LNFNDLHEQCEELVGLTNIYWGNQHQLLEVGIKENELRYSTLLHEVDATDRQIGETISLIKDRLIKAVKGRKGSSCILGQKAEFIKMLNQLQ
jgi:hypothetical protein